MTPNPYSTVCSAHSALIDGNTLGSAVGAVTGLCRCCVGAVIEWVVSALIDGAWLAPVVAPAVVVSISSQADGWEYKRLPSDRSGSREYPGREYLATSTTYVPLVWGDHVSDDWKVVPPFMSSLNAKRLVAPSRKILM